VTSLARLSWLESYAVNCPECDGVVRCICDDIAKCNTCRKFHRPSEDCEEDSNG
jgi:hypothetical protein